MIITFQSKQYNSDNSKLNKYQITTRQFMYGNFSLNRSTTVAPHQVNENSLRKGKENLERVEGKHFSVLAVYLMLPYRKEAISNNGICLTFLCYLIPLMMKSWLSNLNDRSFFLIINIYYICARNYF